MVSVVNLLGISLASITKLSGVKKEKIVRQEAEGKSKVSPFLILLLAMMLGGIVYRGTSVTLPAYFEMNAAILTSPILNLFSLMQSPNVKATMLASTIYLIGMVGQYTGGRVGEQYDLRWAYLVFHGITVPAAIIIALADSWWLFFAATLHSFFLLGMQPIENTLVARLSPKHWLSSA